jgi:hypothetical protein
MGNVGGTAGGYGEAGEGGAATAVGGSAGSLTTGGVAGTGVGGSVSGGGGLPAAGSGGAAGASNFPPFAWTCVIEAWRDGTCHCGCGVPDPDCKDADLDTCKVCDAQGSCSGRKCPGRIDEDNTAVCDAVPAGWTCASRVYDDGTSCDCGCGVSDRDCDEDDLAACDTCAIIGSCSFRDCPGSIDPDDNSQCFIPVGWSCNTFDYGDGICDCGCGVKDVDCPSTSIDDCEFCSHGCNFESCPGTIDEENNAFCTTPPFNWNCAARFYNDGDICHCGCGALDPDCEPFGADDCDRCNVEGSCSGQECPGLIDPAFIGACIQPDPPPEWTCDSFYYGDGGGCDCGCGALDPDCRGTTPAACDGCWHCGECPGRIDPTDITSCLPPPAEWRCDDARYGEGLDCDCGCGVLDPDCGENNSAYCSACPDGSCSRSDCRDVRTDDIAFCDGGVPQGWTCSADFYGDSACDCGCGAQDSDCPNLSASACEFCDSQGSCSEAPTCPGTIDPNDNTSCL